jgi:hypothetical protein
VIPVASPTALTNDYTVIANALNVAQDNWTIYLGKNGSDATFDWSEANALASWELGNDAVNGTDDDWSAMIAPNLDGLTLTAALASGPATSPRPRWKSASSPGPAAPTPT